MAGVFGPGIWTCLRAARAIKDRIQFYSKRRPHQILAMRTPAQGFRLAA